MSQMRLQLGMVIVTMLFFSLTLIANEWIFARTEFVRGVNWIYLPAGARLLCTLLFAEAGAVGLLLISWLVSYYYFFPDDFIRAAVGGILASLAPYLVYRGARRIYGLHASLINLTPGRLLILIVAYSLANSLLHHLWFILHGDAKDILRSFLIMFAGDLGGTLIVIYTIKTALWMAAGTWRRTLR
jgi:hypothetical protein